MTEMSMTATLPNAMLYPHNDTTGLEKTQHLLRRSSTQKL